MENKQKVKISVILFGVFYIINGLGYLIWGATTDSRLYIVDDLLVRFIGLALILSSVGLFFRKEIARKGIIIALSLAIIETFIGIPKEIDKLEFTIVIVFILIMCVPGLAYFTALKNKKYFN
ncbi:MAG: hypothetical protein K0S34_1331 [Bacillales bacterium]|jgi:hypothetical protein|nr:hypothetical protein [Bacillales bacterium]